MNRVATVAAVCAIGLAASAGALAAFGADDDPDAATTIGTGTPTPTPTASVPTTTSTPTTTTPTPTVTTAPPIPRGPLTAANAQAVLPAPGETFEAADPAVELSTVCEGATLEVVDVTPVYASLQTVDDPLQYLDIAIVVYENAPAAAAAYERIAEAIARCPLERTVTAAPTEPDAEPVPVAVTGEVRPDVLAADLPATQWVQVQTTDETELRTAITVVAVQNALVAVSLDQDSETAEADELADDSIAQTAAIAAALAAAG